MRFDHCTTAIEMLTSYLDTCASQDNTLKIVESVKRCVDALVEIETEMRKSTDEMFAVGSEKPKASITSLLSQFKQEVNNCRNSSEVLKPFFDPKNKKALDITLSSLVAVRDTASLLKKINSRITGLEKTIKSYATAAETLSACKKKSKPSKPINPLD